jgi:hypothetical protein
MVSVTVALEETDCCGERLQGYAEVDLSRS